MMQLPNPIPRPLFLPSMCPWYEAIPAPTLSISRFGMLSKLRRENSWASVCASWGWNTDCDSDDLEVESNETKDVTTDFIGEGVWGGSSVTVDCSPSLSVVMEASDSCRCSELSWYSTAVWSIGSPPRSSFSCSLMPHIRIVRSFDHDTS